ncbi:MAG: carboxypeptidase regulatory-like domain-containing protein, partial [Chloroflexi bacterium]|nr:carboxypeptidase regulatory-like domain-containing protein [Chloroflexota bacterium]
MTFGKRLGLGSLIAGVLILVLLRSAAAASLARVEGAVVDADTGMPITGAAIRLPLLAISTASGSGGTFEFHVNLPSADVIPTIIEVTAPGYASWTLQDVRLVPGDTLKL